MAVANRICSCTLLASLLRRCATGFCPAGFFAVTSFSDARVAICFVLSMCKQGKATVFSEVLGEQPNYGQ
jgi:hypothetical protein